MTKPELPQNIFKGTKILVVDDEEVLTWSIDTELKALGAEVQTAGSLREALDRYRFFVPDMAITDLRLPDGNGLELLRRWHHDHPDMPVILITAHGAIDSAVTALRLGAFDYLQKPFEMKSLIAAVQRASEVSKLRQKVKTITGHEAVSKPVEIIGSSPATKAMCDRLRKIAGSKADSALILGETGSGKELAARAIHEWSPRVKDAFVEINCASIPETLLESELFGFEKGAFTDARERKLGLFEMAGEGTIFLDEIGEMQHNLQSKLLRALEYRRFKRLGGTKDIEFKARIVAATNRNLLEEVQAGRFREDLYYRLNVLPVRVPSLRERKSDLPDLTQFLLKALSADLDIACPRISDGAMRKIQEHDWPGNVRELRNVLQRALVFHDAHTLEPQHLEIEAPLQKVTPDFVTSLAPVSMRLGSEFELPESGINLENLERSLLEQALEKAHRNQTRAARLLGISRHTLRYRLEKHGLLEH